MTDTKETLKNRRGFIKAASAVDRCHRDRIPVYFARCKTSRFGSACRPSCPDAWRSSASLRATPVLTEVEKFNAAGGLGGRKIEIITRDSKGKPDEAA